MSDERLRQLERRWLETGSFEDEVHWLEGRLRFGDLTPGRMWTAAFLFHKPARQVLGLVRGDPEIEGVDLTPLQPYLSPSEYDLLRIEATAISIRGTHLTWADVADTDSIGFRALVAVRAWLACPCQPCSEPVGLLAQTCHETQLISAAELCRAVMTSDPATRSELLESAVVRETMQEIPIDVHYSRWERDTDARDLRMTWRKELIPWAIQREPWPEIASLGS